jgi:hypothetical protein
LVSSAPPSRTVGHEIRWPRMRGCRGGPGAALDQVLKDEPRRVSCRWFARLPHFPRETSTFIMGMLSTVQGVSKRSTSWMQPLDKDTAPPDSAPYTGTSGSPGAVACRMARAGCNAVCSRKEDGSRVLEMLSSVQRVSSRTSPGWIRCLVPGGEPVQRGERSPPLHPGDEPPEARAF